MGVPCKPLFPEPRLVHGDGPPVRPGISEEEADELRDLARGHSVLEVGSAWGFSCITMAKVARSVVSVDPHIILSTLADFRANLKAHGVADKVEVIVQYSAAVLPELMVKGRRFELVFIDGDHSPDAVAFDATWARALVTSDGVIAFHDYDTERNDTVVRGLRSWPAPDKLVGQLAVYFGPWRA